MKKIAKLLVATVGLAFSLQAFAGAAEGIAAFLPGGQGKRCLIRGLVLVVGCFFSMTSVHAGSDVVFIDYSDPAYTVYAGLPADRTEDVRRKMAGMPAELVTFEEFASARDKYISQKIVKDEYPGQKAAEGIVALVKKYPNTPFGITWNGGIAMTRMDYQFAKNRFAVFGKDQAEYQRTAPSADPVNPKNHLTPLLGW